MQNLRNSPETQAIFSPRKAKTRIALPDAAQILTQRQQAIDILTKKDLRIALFIGPCSIHDEKSSYEFAEKLSDFSREISDVFFPVMRTFIEKPRTKPGWKGFVHDPSLDGSGNIAEGILRARKLLIDISSLHLPYAMEILDPFFVPYFQDLLTWGFIGARTSASQPHRTIASSLDFPVGFKNDLHGHLESAICGVLTANTSQSHLKIGEQGELLQEKSAGNPHCHIVLRGSFERSNADFFSVQKAKALLSNEGLQERIVIDCAHGNSKKNVEAQKEIFQSVLFQAQNEPAIRGVMLESHLFRGSQKPAFKESLQWGVSITDPCLGWEESRDLIRRCLDRFFSSKSDVPNSREDAPMNR